MSGDGRKQFRHSDSASDSDGSEDDSTSIASYQQVDGAGGGGGVTNAPGSAARQSATPVGVNTRRGGYGHRKRGSRKSRHEWDVVEGLKDGQRCEEKPERFQGYLMKRRKWPMKGWHKRFFVLERGILTYAKSGTDIQRGKYHGIMDIGLAVITFKKPGQRMDIDAEEQVHHIKLKDPKLFENWLQRLRHHRLYRQHDLLYGVAATEAGRLSNVASPTDDSPASPALANANLPELALSQPLKKSNSIRQSSFRSNHGRMSSWLQDNSGLEQISKGINLCQKEITQLRDLIDRIQVLPISSDLGLERTTSCDSDVTIRKKRMFRAPYKRRERKSDSSIGIVPTALSYPPGESSSSPHTAPVTKDRPIFNTSSSSSPSPNASTNTTANTTGSNNNHLQSPALDRLKGSASNPNLVEYHSSQEGRSSSPAQPSSHQRNIGGGSSTNINALAAGTASTMAAVTTTSASAVKVKGQDINKDIPLKMTPHAFKIEEIRLRENYLSSAEGVHSRMKELISQLQLERDRIKTVLEQEPEGGLGQVTSLKIALSESHKQNAELRSRLARIHAESTLPSDFPSSVATPILSPLPGVRLSRSHENKGGLAQSLSIDSFSMSEYYDAEENFGGTNSDYSSEPSDDEVSSDISDDENDTDHTTGGYSVSEAAPQPICATGRRSRLPVPKPESPDVSMWNLLYRNIGKDLTKISMPVTLNEPLSMLQRLCEEMEYSELLDKAAEYDDPYERMIYVAAFAVSGYASSYYREGHKPFNPLLGETYECVREDKGWQFIGEQVCHHPPIAACHCESKNFIIWQDVRIKTKFWGKSMEIQPLGHVHCALPKYRDHYKWNKVTTCVHNLLGGQRWADQYGEMTITNGNIVCKLTFTKGANNSSPKRYEVYGSINTADGKVVHNLFGKWNEAFFCGHATTAKCVWRPGAMPEDYELYYGFTRFAIELNELNEDLTKFLPPTDTRFRPDQRLMEEGKIAEAEAEKHRLENSQRDRRKARDSAGEEHKPMWFKKVKADGKTEVYEYGGKYWPARKDPGFKCMSFMKLF